MQTEIEKLTILLEDRDRLLVRRELERGSLNRVVSEQMQQISKLLKDLGEITDKLIDQEKALITLEREVKFLRRAQAASAPLLLEASIEGQP